MNEFVEFLEETAKLLKGRSLEDIRREIDENAEQMQKVVRVFAILGRKIMTELYAEGFSFPFWEEPGMAQDEINQLTGESA